ncbi:MAG: hypothetical protein KAH01_03920 [Caldisericia bacterium]|nr:hypothetical protein [Caldisericia bacterium]
MKKFISVIAVFFLFISIFSILPTLTLAEEKDPLSIEKIIGLTSEIGTFRVAAQDGSYFSPMYQLGICVGDDGKIFVVDSGESQIEVFGNDLVPILHFGGIGKEDGKFMYLTSVNLCSKGNLYLTDSFIGKVSVMTQDGKFIKSFDEEMVTPTDVAFLPDGSILVTDVSSGVLKYDAEGKYIGPFSNYTGLKPSPDDMYGPSQIEITKEGIVYISASSISGICKMAAFDKDGNHLIDCIEPGTNDENIGGLLTGLSIENNILVVSQLNGQKSSVKKFEIPTNPKDLLEFLEIVASPPSGRTIEKDNIMLPSGACIKDEKTFVLDGLLSTIMVFNKNNDFMDSHVSTTDGTPIYSSGMLYTKDTPKGILSNPQGVRVDQDGNIYVGNSNYYNVVVFDSEGEDIEHLGHAAKNRDPDPGEFFSPTDVCLDEDGFIYVSDTRSGLIHVFDPDHEPWTIIDEGFSYPQGLCVNSEGYLLVVNSKSASLSVIDTTEILDEYAEEVDNYPIDGTWPVGVSCDADDNMFIALTGSDKVVSMDPDGDVITEWGESGSEPGQMNGPQGTCVDGEGNVYVAETNGGRIQKFTPEGDLIWTSEMQWPGLTFITMDYDGKLYVTDCLHSTVVVLNDSTAVPPDNGKVKESETVFTLEASEEIKAGSEFTVNINAEKIEDISKIEFGFTIPFEHITFDSVTGGKLLGPGKISDTDVMDETIIFDLMCKNGISGTGTVAVMKFHAKETGDVEILFDRIKMFNLKNKEVTIKDSKSLKFTILKGDTEPPIIKIEDIPEVIYEDNYTIKGSTELDAKVTINDKEVALDKKGNFSYDVKLKLGENIFTVKATDLSENVAETKITINREKRTVLKFVIGRKTYILNDEPELLDAAPFVHEGRTVLPIRPVVEAIDGDIGWDSKTRKVTIKKDDITIELWIDNPKAKINGKDATIDDNPSVKPMIVAGRTFLPLRFVAESLGFAVGWDGTTQTITLTYPKP